MSDTEWRVRERAYELWEAAGRPHDQTDECWYRARQEVEGGIPTLGDAPDGTIDHPPGEMSVEDPPELLVKTGVPGEIPPESVAAMDKAQAPVVPPVAAKATAPLAPAADPKATVRPGATNIVRKAANAADAAAASQPPRPPPGAARPAPPRPGLK